jgi:hypothetical protein
MGNTQNEIKPKDNATEGLRLCLKKGLLGNSLRNKMVKAFRVEMGARLRFKKDDEEIK